MGLLKLFVVEFFIPSLNRNYYLINTLFVSFNMNQEILSIKNY